MANWSAQRAHYTAWYILNIFNYILCFYKLQMMQSNTYHNSHAYGNAELYQEVFKVLDNLGMADLKVTFQEHCIQVFFFFDYYQ